MEDIFVLVDENTGKCNEIMLACSIVIKGKKTFEKITKEFKNLYLALGRKFGSKGRKAAPVFLDKFVDLLKKYEAIPFVVKLKTDKVFWMKMKSTFGRLRKLGQRLDALSVGPQSDLSELPSSYEYVWQSMMYYAAFVPVVQVAARGVKVRSIRVWYDKHGMKPSQKKFMRKFSDEMGTFRLANILARMSVFVPHALEARNNIRRTKRHTLSSVPREAKLLADHLCSCVGHAYVPDRNGKVHRRWLRQLRMHFGGPEAAIEADVYRLVTAPNRELDALIAGFESIGIKV